jgi:hypothetical protein
MTAVGVTLNDNDLAACDTWAEQRTDNWQVATRETNYDQNLYGVKGELALAKALQIDFVGYDDMLEADRAGDVGPYQVKATMHPEGHLIFQQQHRMGVQTVLAIVGTNKVRLAGWSHFDTAKTIVASGTGHKEWRNDQQNVMTWWLPKHALEGMEWLPIVYGPEVVKL